MLVLKYLQLKSKFSWSLSTLAALLRQQLFFYHITSDEVMCWDQWYRLTAEAAGVEPRLVHIPSDFIAACVPEARGGLLGDKAVSVVFDNTKIKRFVPGFCATVPFTQLADRRQWIDEHCDGHWQPKPGHWVDYDRKQLPSAQLLFFGSYDGG